jgi:hypothetical protein
MKTHTLTNVVVVIGAGLIGQAIARRVSAGKHIVLADLRQENADTAAKIFNDARPKNPNGEPGEFTTLFNGMIYFLAGYPIKGAIWYQGEANSGPNNQYGLMFASMVNDWRKHWGFGRGGFLLRYTFVCRVKLCY